MVVVDLSPVKFCSVVEPFTRRVPSCAIAANRFEDEALVAKKFVEVELLVVALSPVKFCNVDEADAWRLPRVTRPFAPTRKSEVVAEPEALVVEATSKIAF